MGIKVGDVVKLVVPFGPNAGQIFGFGKVVGSINSGIDGIVYDVLMVDGDLNRETAESWVRPMTTINEFTFCDDCGRTNHTWENCPDTRDIFYD